MLEHPIDLVLTFFPAPFLTTTFPAGLASADAQLNIVPATPNMICVATNSVATTATGRSEPLGLSSTIRESEQNSLPPSDKRIQPRRRLCLVEQGKSDSLGRGDRVALARHHKGEHFAFWHHQ